MKQVETLLSHLFLSDGKKNFSSLICQKNPSIAGSLGFLKLFVPCVKAKLVGVTYEIS